MSSETLNFIWTKWTLYRLNEVLTLEAWSSMVIKKGSNAKTILVWVSYYIY